jgi:8-hydroxy-5-deazaflavin:NADPH oxidoreductase
MRIGIIGSGNMGRSLCILWAQAGHEVFFGARDPAQAERAAGLAGGNARHGSNDEAARFGDVLLYTVRHHMPSAVLTDLGAMAGKVVIDLNNWDIPPGFAFEPITESLAEKLQADVPQVRVVKAFNTMAQEVFELSGTGLDLHDVSVFVAGNDRVARETTMRLAADIGFSPVDCGELRHARLIEGLGDFIRLLIGGMKRGPMATISTHTLPAPRAQRLGGREPSRLAGRPLSAADSKAERIA